MAAPHVNGAIGLLWSAVPKLQRRINETMSILYRSARHQATDECGTEKKSPNNVYGYGTVNILAAYKLAKREGW
jgi:subtilisin family serine protease